MATGSRSAVWIMGLSLVAPVVAGDTGVLVADTGATTDSNGAAQPVCRNEIYTGSRIPMEVCADSEAPVQSIRMSEQIMHPDDLAFILRTRFPSLTVHSGLTSGASVRR